VTPSARRGRLPALGLFLLDDRAVPANLPVPLDPAQDQLGHQVLTVQEYRGADGVARTGEPR
jgi:hypothetical protein